jgi:formate dehydrogenase iron-sulfur subunit
MRDSLSQVEAPYGNGQRDDDGKISRRRFLMHTAAAGGSLLLASSLLNPLKVSAKSLSGWPDRYGMLTDMIRCIGCRRCEDACNEINGLPAPEIPFDDKSVFEEKRRTDTKSLTVVNRYQNKMTGEPVYRKVQCNHCAEPACASACLVGALKKSPDGPVTYDESICIGCRYCMTACPFYIPAFEYFDAVSPAIKKCSMCYDTRILKGEVPACATECPVEAITFGKRKDLISLARDRIGSNPRYIDHIYGEHEVGGTDWLYISGTPYEQLHFPEDLGDIAYPELTKEFLSAVPLVVAIWPALLGGFYLLSNRNQGTDTAQAGDLEQEDNRQ